MDNKTVLYVIIGLGATVVLGLSAVLLVVMWPNSPRTPGADSGKLFTETPVYYQGISGWNRNSWRGFFLSINERNGQNINGRMHWPRFNMTVAVKGTIEGNKLTFYDHKFVSGSEHPDYSYNEEKNVTLEGDVMHGWDGDDAVIYAKRTNRARYLESVESAVHDGFVNRWGPDYASGGMGETVTAFVRLAVLGALLAALAVTELWLIVLAFMTNPLWGIGFILFPPVQFVFCVLHFDKAKVPFLSQLGIGVITLLLVMFL